jgi:hypothetical protein
MRIDCALLCDSVTIREGLLHILGGGITRANRDNFPAPLNLALALRIMVHPTEAEHTHELAVLLLGQDGERIAELGIQFGINDPAALEPAEEASLPLALSLHTVPLPREGPYSFQLLIDGIHQGTVPFRAVKMEGTAQEGQVEE